MKVLVLFTFLNLLMFTSCQEEAQNKSSKTTVKAEASTAVLPEELQEEDCDDKAKKLEKELPQEINLQGGGDAGCSLDELNSGAHP